MSKEVLFENQWLSLMVAKKPEAGVNGYVYSHETRCKGRIMAILPFKKVLGTRQPLFLVKLEMTPCWSFDRERSAITGGYEGGDIKRDAIRELYEEAGYTAVSDDLIPLGESYASKSSDTIYSLFSIDLTNRESVKAPGDGSQVEAASEAIWLPRHELLEIKDPQVAVMLLRLEDSRVMV